jgi:hypothetical protein
VQNSSASFYMGNFSQVTSTGRYGVSPTAPHIRYPDFFFFEFHHFSYSFCYQKKLLLFYILQNVYRRMAGSEEVVKRHVFIIPRLKAHVK